MVAANQGGGKDDLHTEQWKLCAGSVVVVVDVVNRPSRIWVVELPDGFEAVAVHVLLRMSQPEVSVSAATPSNGNGKPPNQGNRQRNPNQGNHQFRESAPTSADYPVRGLVPFVTRPECRCGKSAVTSFVGFMYRCRGGQLSDFYGRLNQYEASVSVELFVNSPSVGLFTHQV
ncbi:F-box/kelch-repeat protein SKIP25 [Linum perenne]